MDYAGFFYADMFSVCSFLQVLAFIMLCCQHTHRYETWKLMVNYTVINGDFFENRVYCLLWILCCYMLLTYKSPSLAGRGESVVDRQSLLLSLYRTYVDREINGQLYGN